MSELQFTEENGGWMSELVSGLSREELWVEFVNKVRHPDLYLPCVDVSYKDNVDGTVWRSMRIPKGALQMMPEGATIVENIVMDEAAGDVSFHVLDDDGKPSGLVHHNRLHEVPGGFKIEYVDIKDGHRTPLKASGTIQKMVERARKTKAEKST